MMLLPLLAPLALPLLDAGDGVRVAAPVEVARGDAPAVAVDTKGALVVWRDRGCVKAARLGGTAIELACGATGAPRIAAGATASLVVWPAGAGIAGVLVTPKLEPTKAFRLDRRALSLEAAFDGTQFLVAAATCTEAILVRVDAAGQASAPRVLATAKASIINGVNVACGPKGCEVGYSVTVTDYPRGVTCEMHHAVFRNGGWRAAPVVNGELGAIRELGALYPDRPNHHTTSVLHDHGMPLKLSRYGTRRFVARGTSGVLVAAIAYEADEWNGKETIKPPRFSISFEAAAARHEPLAVPGETDPAIAALGGDRFVLVTAARGTILARTIAIDPAYFAKPPPPRGPVLQGTVRGSNQQPVQANLGCQLQDSRCGATTISANGVFAIPPGDPLDHRFASRTDVVPVIAMAGTEYWFDPAVRAGRRDIPLRAEAKLIAHVTWPGGKLPAAKPMPPRFVDDGPRGKRRLPDEDPLEVSVVALPEVPISGAFGPTWATGVSSIAAPTAQDVTTFGFAATGRALVQAHTRNGEWGASTWISVEPGKPTKVELAMQRTSTMVLRLSGVVLGPTGRVTITDLQCSYVGDDPCALEHVPPGPQLVNITDANWTMQRELVLPAGTKKPFDVPFVADLPPGHAGVKLARAIDGIVVTAIAPGGPASKLLEVDDRIVAIDGTPVGVDLAGALARIHGAPGTQVKLDVERARKPRTVTLVRSRGTALPGYSVILR